MAPARLGARGRSMPVEYVASSRPPPSAAVKSACDKTLSGRGLGGGQTPRANSPVSNYPNDATFGDGFSSTVTGRQQEGRNLVTIISFNHALREGRANDRRPGQLGSRLW